MTKNSHSKFDASRAGEYGQQARIALAGYDACHELTACILSASLEGQKDVRILVVGAGGTAGEIIAAGKLESDWKFLAVDPSEPMAALAQHQIQEAHLEDRVEFVIGELSELPSETRYDAAIMIGVLHHIADDNDKGILLSQISARLKSNAPMVIAGNYRSYGSEPLLMAAWAARWRMHGVEHDEVQAKLGKILDGASPPENEAKVEQLLADAGFEKPQRFFSSLFWGAWHTIRTDG